MDFTGKITFIGSVELVGKNWLEKRTFVLEEVSDKEWKQSIAIDIIKDKVSYIDKFKEGDVVKAKLNFKTNYSENSQRYYNSVNAWGIEGVKVDDGHAFPEDDSNSLPF